ncbi:protein STRICTOSIDINE SYNTHASE-LIKE 10-like isoform X2 [Carica papaya]|uniref:protein STRICTOSIDINE SYNTHASE-LIKE 10-like isoform X2 n=1 Tax=Carica papaya TaxID=3649 RepID=UPI000B8C9617|nr:protein STRICTOSIDINE SYNTHASE-LIKE 10-like isoform X2 [Carica papaya]
MDKKKLVVRGATAVAVAFLAIFLAPFFYPVPKIKGSRDVLHASRVLDLSTAGAVAGESLDFDPKGEGPYTGVADGRILKWEGESVGWREFAIDSPHRQSCTQPSFPQLEHICGRPLGVMFEKKSGDLYIDDCYLGLMVVGPEGGLAKQLAIEAEGLRFDFTNHMDIDELDDVIYFTDSSKVYNIRTYMNLIMSGDRTGRLIKYEKKNRKTTVLLKGLGFPNGVALSKDRSFVLVAESTRFRVLRFWLRGPNAGKHDVFADLPGAPDNIRRNEKGEFWVAMYTKKTLFAYMGFTNPWFGNILLKLLNFSQLNSLLIGGTPHALAAKLSETGEIIEVLEDSKGKTLAFISEVLERDGKLWIGSITTPYIGIYDYDRLWNAES